MLVSTTFVIKHNVKKFANFLLYSKDIFEKQNYNLGC